MTSSEVVGSGSGDGGGKFGRRFPRVSGIVTLGTDFGSGFGYVGEMKGVILSGATARGIALPTIVDVSHDVAPGDVRSGAFLIEGVYRRFPRGTIHVGVVDPGVGGSRSALLIECDGHWFVGPDNGLFSRVLEESTEGHRAWALSMEAISGEIAPTFHGRDVFAPAATRLLAGDPIEDFTTGPIEPIRKSFLAAIDPDRPDMRSGLVIRADRFGNLITNIRVDAEMAEHPEAWRIGIAGKTIRGLSRTYCDRPAGALMALTSSRGFLEIAVNMGSAAERLKAGTDEPVEARRSAEDRAERDEAAGIGKGGAEA